jgi:hypothetical protein
MSVLSGGNMKKLKKKRAKKKISALDRIKKELEKLEKLHDKENDIVEKINDIIDEDEGNDLDLSHAEREWR